MAAAEARAVWQRAANRYFVQEDAKRAPKLACCQSSSSTSKPVDAEPATEASKPDHLVAGFKPLSRTPSYPDLPPDARWWLQKGVKHEQLNALEAEVEMLRAGILNSNVGVRKDYEVGKQGVKAVYSMTSEEVESIDVEDSYVKLEMDSLGYSDSKKSSGVCYDPASPWVGSDKTDPWWRVTDKNDLASFVAHKSLDHVENCDLPPSQKIHAGRNTYSGLQVLNSNENVASSHNWKVQNGVVLPNNEQGSHDSGRAQGREWNSAQVHMQYRPAKPFRTSNSIPLPNNTIETQISENDPSKAELLDALRHSQTRAREAEKAAQQAHAEKEHIVKLFFRQASQLFAYKQWFQMLQLESLYTQVKNNEQPISSLFPVGLPWMPSRGKKTRKSWQKGRRGKRNRSRPNFGNYFVAIALGLGLVGAGLLLGWTVGWLLPF